MFWGVMTVTMVYSIWMSFSAAADISPQNRAYDIRDCGSFSDQVGNALDLGKEPLDAAIKSAKQGVKGLHGFQSWFKDDTAIPKVTEILKNIQSMKGLRRLIPYPNIWIAQQPVFVCVNESTFTRYGTRLRRDPYKTCQELSLYGLYMPGWRYIFICERYFTLRKAPLGPPLRNCPHIVGNRFVVDAEMTRLAYYQTYALIHEMVHFYLQRASLGFNTDPKETYASNLCVNFDTKTSLRNPQNFQFFVAMVENGCTIAPNPFLPPFPLPPRNLVEGEERSNRSGNVGAVW